LRGNDLLEVYDQHQPTLGDDAMRGTILDPVTGKPVEGRVKGLIHSHNEDFVINPSMFPEHVQESLRKGRERPGSRGPRMSGVTWRDLLTPRRVVVADGTQVLNSTSETIMCPDFTFAADAVEPGDVFKYTLFGSMSTVITTPGTITFRLRWGGVAGTSLAASGAFAPDPTAAATTLSYCVEWYFVVRTTGSSGTGLAFAKIVWNDFDDASATTLKGNLDMQLAPVSAPATATINTTTSSALSPTVQFSVNTATTQLTNGIALLESIN